MSTPYLSNYQLGILYSVGTYLPSENRFVIRHKDKHYIDILTPVFKTNPYTQNSRTQIQYVLKSSTSQNLNPYDNTNNLSNWSSYNSEIKTIQILSDYKDFLRAYIEIHSTLDYSTRYKNKKEKYKALRLRIYGNKIFLESINNILHDYAYATIKSIQILSNNKTAILQYTSYTEILSIYDYIQGEPYNKELWNNIFQMLDNPIINYL